MQVIATEVIANSPQSGSTTVHVSVINENDNAPNFVNQSYSATIPENAPAGTFVAIVRCMTLCSQVDKQLNCNLV